MRVEPWSLRLYRRLLFLYPPGFRREAGEELVETFRQQRQDTLGHGWPGFVKLWASITLDLISSCGSLWWQSLADGREARRAAKAHRVGRGGGRE